MKTFHCSHCNQQVFYENVLCERCDSTLGFIEGTDAGTSDDDVDHNDVESHGIGDISAFQADDDGTWHRLPVDDDGRPRKQYKQCHNYAVEHVCNRMIPAHDPQALCRSCRLTTIIPSLASGQNRDYWYKLERAKRRMLYTLVQLDLPIVSRHDDPETGLAFEFLENFSGGPMVHTGHSDGLITINVAEADDAQRASTRVQMEERYRTLLGHFRHEIGHYYFMRMMEDSPLIAQCRALFGDDRADYDTALQRHYDNGPPDDWQASYISAYATMHPYEDWAETWAHYMHMVDTLETAAACGMALTPDNPDQPAMPADRLDPDTRSFREMVARWFPLTYALNSLNRSMGTRDSYPFTLTQPVLEKLRFVHHAIRTKGMGYAR